MCSVVEANVANICTSIPTLGYQVLFVWYKKKTYGVIRGDIARGRTIGFSQWSGYNYATDHTEQELDDVAEQHRRPTNRVIDF